MEKRTDVCFDKHELTILEDKYCKIYKFYKPDTTTHGLSFINCCGVLSVIGDWGNWIFCREFHPSEDGYVSDGYWIEKLRINSQQEPFVYNGDDLKQQINEFISDEDHGWTDEELEFWNELSDATDDSEYVYIAKAMDRPFSIDPEYMPRTKSDVNFWLLVIFDAFDEICKRMKDDKQNKNGYDEDYYRVFDVNKELFDKIPSEMCISGTNDSVKYLCANIEEFKLLTSLGLNATQSCDWYKINLI